MTIARYVLTALLLLFFGLLAWLLTQHLLFYRQIVLQLPLDSKEGAILDRSFTVEVPAKYWFAVKRRRAYKISAIQPLPEDDFAIAYTIKADGNIISQGATDALPKWPRPAAVSHDFITRFIAAFEARPEHNYEILLRVVHAPMVTTNSEFGAMVVIDPHFDPDFGLRRDFLASVGVVLAVSSFLYWLNARRTRRI